MLDNPAGTAESLPALESSLVEKIRIVLSGAEWIAPHNNYRTALIFLHSNADAEPTDEEAAVLSTVLDDAIDAARRALSQAERNTDGLRAARLDLETARDIVVASNEMAARRAGAV